MQHLLPVCWIQNYSLFMSDSSKQRTQRPDNNGQPFQATPKYVKHEAYEDRLAILVCQIKIWKPKGNKWYDIPSDFLMIRECESIEIADSSKELINKAVVKFPRGTVINLSSAKTKAVKTGTEADNTTSTQELKKASNDGELITTSTSTLAEDGVSVTSMAPNYDDKGLVKFNRSKDEVALLQPNDVAIGNRIEIRLGYAYSEAEFNKMNKEDGTNMDLVFTGFITSVSVDTPLEIECTNMAHILTTISVPDISEKDSVPVKDFLDAGGKWDLLKDTGIELSDASKGSDISVKGGTISNNITVADVLNEWGKAGVLCIMEIGSNGKAYLRVGLAYFAGKGGGGVPNGDKKYITYNGGNNSLKIIQFDWDVAQDKLSLMRNDKKYLAVEAQGTDGKKFFKFTLIKSPDADDGGWIIDTGGTNNYEGQFRQVNKRENKSKKNLKYPDGTKSKKRTGGHLANKVDLSKYNVIPYFSTKIGVTEDELMEEAKQYWAAYVPNGITGTISIFGDVLVRPTEIIGLVDMRQPEKNGYYFVESVNTTFGLNGYRRELKMPYKIAKFSKNVTII